MSTPAMLPPDAARAPLRFEFCPPGHFGGFRAALTERTGGESPDPYRSLNLGRSTADLPERVRANEARVIRALGLPDCVARLRLEHGRSVLQVDRSGLHGPADAILTARAGLVLWLTVADCFPLAVAAGPIRVLGHCGWRGVAAGLTEEILAHSTRLSGVLPSQQRAWIGPGIGSCCYPVGPEVARQFPESARFLPEATAESEDSLGRLSGSPARSDAHSAASALSGGPPGTFRLDLRAEIRRRLLRLGFPAEAIAVSPSCTSCEAGRFFSFRRDGARSGRMAALFWRESAPAGASDGPLESQ